MSHFNIDSLNKVKRIYARWHNFNRCNPYKIDKTLFLNKMKINGFKIFKFQNIQSQNYFMKLLKKNNFVCLFSL